MSPEFSVIIPVYKTAKYLPACLDSVLGQSYGNFELILVDDGSPDECGAICDEYAARDSRVQVIHQPNSGVVAARRAALDRAKADYIAFVDGDDTVTPDWMQTIHDCMTEHGWPDMLLFGGTWVREDGSRPDRANPPRLAPGLYDKDRLRQEVYPFMICDRRAKHRFSQLIAGYLWEKVFRRQLLLEHYLQDESIPIFEDALMVYECLYCAESLAVCPALLYFYLVRADSAVHRRSEKDFMYLEKCMCYLDGHLLRLAPQLRPQTDMFFTAQLQWTLEREFTSGFTLRQAVSHLAAPLRQTDVLGHLTTVPGQPFYRILLFLLRRGWLRAALVMVLIVYRKNEYVCRKRRPMGK